MASENHNEPTRTGSFRNNNNRDVVVEHRENTTPLNHNNISVEATPISLEELQYGASSFHAIVSPVLCTMLLAGIAVIYVQTPESRSASEDQISGFYTVFDVSSNNSNSAATNFGLSLINGLIMISVIAAATFVIVLLYKYKCMKLLMGYMVVASASLLGLLGGIMLATLIERYEIMVDQVTYYFLLANFASVGTISIFYSKGIPTYITQGYLVLTSVILAWQLSHFNDWTAWTLLVLLALYDLCAVLTPCGPLRALVKLMQREGSQPLPGLLYEAQLPEGVDRPGRGRNSSSRTSSTQNNTSVNGDPTAANPNSTTRTANSSRSSSRTASTSANPTTNRISRNRLDDPNVTHQLNSEDVLGTVPFAICRVYKLTVFPQGCPEFVREKYQVEASTPPTYTREELLTPVCVVYPRNGGMISHADDLRNRHDSMPRYKVFGRDGEVKRVLVVNEDGRVFEELRGENSNDDAETESKPSNSIKLGLGDFIFYSVLVAKAAQNSFTTFASCILVILAGLGGTLVLLSVYHNALPALPISIFLGVVFYFATKAVIEPWVETILTSPYYV